LTSRSQQSTTKSKYHAYEFAYPVADAHFSYLYLLMPNVTSVEVLRLNGPANATSIQQMDISGPAAALQLLVSEYLHAPQFQGLCLRPRADPNFLVGMASYVKA
jgi:hypothetical protein